MKKSTRKPLNGLNAHETSVLNVFNALDMNVVKPGHERRVVELIDELRNEYWTMARNSDGTESALMNSMLTMYGILSRILENIRNSDSMMSFLIRQEMVTIRMSIYDPKAYASNICEAFLMILY